MGGNGAPAAERPYVQPTWWTVCGLAAIVTFADRAAAVTLPSMVYSTTPLPVCGLAEVIDSHGAALALVHGQPSPVVTAMLPLPPFTPAANVAVPSVYT